MSDSTKENGTQADTKSGALHCSAAPSVEIVRIGDDPFGRGEPTVFYRDKSISDTEVFYLWVKFWNKTYPALAIK